MEILLKRQPQKYLAKTDTNTYKKIKKALDGLQELEGDIVKLKGSDCYRLKIYHYRIIFSVNLEDNSIIVEEINTRGNVY